MKTLTVSEVKKACSENKYILAHYINGAIGGINTKISNLVLKRKNYRDQKHTKIVTVYPCDFNTYLSFKAGFVR